MTVFIQLCQGKYLYLNDVFSPKSDNDHFFNTFQQCIAQYRFVLTTLSPSTPYYWRPKEIVLFFKWISLFSFYKTGHWTRRNNQRRLKSSACILIHVYHRIMLITFWWPLLCCPSFTTVIRGLTNFFYLCTRQKDEKNNDETASFFIKKYSSLPKANVKTKENLQTNTKWSSFVTV